MDRTLVHGFAPDRDTSCGGQVEGKPGINKHNPYLINKPSARVFFCVIPGYFRYFNINKSPTVLRIFSQLATSHTKGFTLLNAYSGPNDNQVRAAFQRFHMKFP